MTEHAATEQTAAEQAAGEQTPPEQTAAEQTATVYTAGERAAQFARLYAEDRVRHQLGFYSQRRAEAERAHVQAIHAKWTLATLAAIAGSVGAAVPSARVALAIAAAFLAAAATALTAYQSLYAFPRIAKLYRDAEMSLSALTAAGNALGDLTPEQTRAVVDRVERIFLQETGQWGQLIRHAADEHEHNEVHTRS